MDWLRLFLFLVRFEIRFFRLTWALHSCSWCLRHGLTVARAGRAKTETDKNGMQYDSAECFKIMSTIVYEDRTTTSTAFVRIFVDCLDVCRAHSNTESSPSSTTQIEYLNVIAVDVIISTINNINNWSMHVCASNNCIDPEGVKRKTDRTKKMPFISGKINLPLDNDYDAVFFVSFLSFHGKLKLIRARVVIGKQNDGTTTTRAHTYSHQMHWYRLTITSRMSNK